MCEEPFNSTDMIYTGVWRLCKDDEPACQDIRDVRQDTHLLMSGDELLGPRQSGF